MSNNNNNHNNNNNGASGNVNDAVAAADALNEQTSAVFDGVARYFADPDTYRINMVIVPDNDPKKSITLRKDALSNDRLVLELDMGGCESCPTDATGQTIYDSYECVALRKEQTTIATADGDQAALQVSEGKIEEPTRCQVAIENSPRALFEALRLVKDMVVDDPDRPLYAVRQKFPEDAPKRTLLSSYEYPLHRALEHADASPLSTSVPSPTKPTADEPPVWQYILIGLAALLVMGLVATLAVYVLRQTCGPPEADKKSGALANASDSQNRS